MPDHKLFGTEQHPLRMSQLPRLAGCTVREFLQFMGDLTDESGPAADTGSMVHGMIAAWHLSGFDPSHAARAVAALQAQFPLADPETAAAHFAGYANDPRNRVELFGRPETPVRLRVPMGDGQPDVVVNGTLDQLRVGEDGVLEVWDVKTGKPSGLSMLDSYALQLAGYALGAAQTLGRDVRLGGIVRTVGYLARGVSRNPSPDGVFYHVPWGPQVALLLLDTVKRAVRQVRAGEADFAPGYGCQVCPARGFQNCLPLLQKYL